MEDKKLAAIQAAYGDAWEKVKEHVDDNGWCEYMVFPHDLGFNEVTAEKDLIVNTVRWRPRSLSGLENNNGWVRLDEKEPTVGDYYVCRDGEFDGGILHSHEITLSGNHYDVTHWRLIERPKPPIY